MIPYPDDIFKIKLDMRDYGLTRNEVRGGKFIIEQRPDGSCWVDVTGDYGGSAVQWVNMAKIASYDCYPFED